MIIWIQTAPSQVIPTSEVIYFLECSFIKNQAEEKDATAKGTPMIDHHQRREEDPCLQLVVEWNNNMSSDFT